MSDVNIDELQESLVETFREESLELLTDLESALLELEKTPDDQELINRAFRALHTIKGNAGMFGFEEIEEFTHELETVFDRVRKGGMAADAELIDLTLSARDVVLKMLRGTGGEPLTEEGEVLLATFRKMTGESAPVGNVIGRTEKEPQVTAEDMSGDASRTPESAKGEGGEKEHAGASMRVASGKLDKLVDLVGEMVTVQARLTQIVSDRVDPELVAVAEEVESLTWELRENTFSIRMVPIGTAYRRIRRLVRDLSRDLDQEVELVTDGSETELDKTVIEKLTDPLMHLIRNSVDHGIETPEIRERSGKPPKGTIRLSATNSGADVVIRVQDDGAGLDIEAIRGKAVARGLITHETELSEDEVLSLIFAPGFSTATKVSNVSGRGVGLDVVKRSIEDMRGMVEVTSDAGEGTAFTIRLPLTLAIIEGLLLLVGTDKYIVPLSMVEECVELTVADIAGAHGRNLTSLRGQIVPYVGMRDLFGVIGDPPAIQQIVILREEGRRAGILVDHVIGEHQTVIKSLGKVYRGVQGLSGATILGDGTVSLILDVQQIMRIAQEHELTAARAAGQTV